MSDNIELKHLGLIIDGNRRWAKANNLPQLEGHRKGSDNLLDIGIAAYERGIKYVSAYVFSTENWNRSKEEVSYLMEMIIYLAKKKINELHKRDIKLLVAGSRERVPKAVLKALDLAMEKTKNNGSGVFILCLNYGGHQEILDAVNKAITHGDGQIQTKESFEQYLYVPEVPPLDLVIRTSGEQRLSNFMLWRSAYSELLFVDKYWPDFTADDLSAAIDDFTNRQRRFGS